MDIQNFIDEFKKTFVYDMLKDYVSDEKLFDHVIENTQVIWIKEQTRQMWSMWQKSKTNTVSASLENDCMISQTWFMKGSPVSALIKHAEDVYKAEAIAQNSKIKFGTDDNKHWFAHDVPFFGRVQIDRIEEHGLVEWDIFFNECWQGPFNTKSKCIRHLEECIKEMHEEAQEQGNE